MTHEEAFAKLAVDLQQRAKDIMRDAPAEAKKQDNPFHLVSAAAVSQALFEVAVSIRALADGGAQE